MLESLLHLAWHISIGLDVMCAICSCLAYREHVVNI